MNQDQFERVAKAMCQADGHDPDGTYLVGGLACPVSTLAGFAPSTLFDRSSPQGDLCSGCGLARRQLGVSARHEHGLARTTGLRTPIRPCETRAKDAAPFPPSVSSRSGSGPQHLQCVT